MADKTVNSATTDPTCGIRGDHRRRWGVWLYRRLRRLAVVGNPIRRLAASFRLGTLHIRSRQMKLKLRVLARRQLLLTGGREIPARIPVPVCQTPSASAQRTGPIWIHGSWRTGSTYVWGKFRGHPDYFAYYEPFHEVLETLSLDDIARTTTTAWPSHHPDIGAPYYAEYRPLVETIGVKGFEFPFSYINFFLHADPLPAQKRYLDGLLAHAAGRGRPVFGFCRSWGRVGWFKRHFAGTHIALTRDPLALWRSAHRRLAIYGDTYFLVMPQVILHLAQRDMWLQNYLKELGLGQLTRYATISEARHAAERTLRHKPAQAMACFVASQCLASVIAERYADVVLRIDELATDSGRRVLADVLQSRYDISLDWCDCHIPAYAPRDQDQVFLDSWSQARRLAEQTLDTTAIFTHPVSRP